LTGDLSNRNGLEVVITNQKDEENDDRIRVHFLEGELKDKYSLVDPAHLKKIEKKKKSLDSLGKPITVITLYHKIGA